MDSSSVDSSSVADEPIQKRIQMVILMVMMAEMDLELSQTPITMNKLSFGYIKANGNKSY